MMKKSERKKIASMIRSTMRLKREKVSDVAAAMAISSQSVYNILNCTVDFNSLDMRKRVAKYLKIPLDTLFPPEDDD